MYCDYFIWHVSCTVYVLTFFYMWLCVFLQFVICGCLFYGFNNVWVSVCVGFIVGV
jgi:hypothetical protein